MLVDIRRHIHYDTHLIYGNVLWSQDERYREAHAYEA